MTTHSDTVPDTDNVRLLPGEGEGTLTTPGGDRLPVRAFRRGQDVVLVVLDPITPEDLEERLEAADLEYSSIRGVVRLHGDALIEGPSLIRFEPEGTADVTQRRSFVRVRAPQGLCLALDHPDLDRVHTIDLSGGGILLADAEALQDGQSLRFTISLDDGEPAVEGVGRVVRAGDDGRRALAFEQISETDRDRLIRYVFDCMRRARARTRGDRF